MFASFGLVANAVSMAILHRSDTGSLNLRGAANEVFADLLGSVLAVAAGVVIWVWDWQRADPVASLVIAVMILPRAVLLMKDAAVVLLEIAPAGLDLDDIQRHLCGVPGVVDVHDLHAWTITSGIPSLSAHVTVTDEALAERGVGPILDDLGECVSDALRGAARDVPGRAAVARGPRGPRRDALTPDYRTSLLNWHPSPRPGYGVRRYDCGPAHTAAPPPRSVVGNRPPGRRRPRGSATRRSARDPTRLWLRARPRARSSGPRRKTAAPS